MQSCAEEDGVIVSDHQGLISSSNSERQSEHLVPKALCPFVLEINKDLHLHLKSHRLTERSSERHSAK